jgi:hypothetical protein
MDLIGFPLDFVRQVIEQTMFEEHLKNPKYFGGDGQVYLLPFYEELVKEENVDRYVETLRDLIDQQNRTGLIMLGTVLADENPTITNLAQDFTFRTVGRTRFYCLILLSIIAISVRLQKAKRNTVLVLENTATLQEYSA